ncbi:hypothetical protein BGX21_003819 [Mortierella sp. AD011]|nr:hypothetical protein BGX20_005661 [Mortierella sp. AD010]KAF9400628.1 hypothetical protein BGX21_003819 [Mortierella sp. AD011]
MEHNQQQHRQNQPLQQQQQQQQQQQPQQQQTQQQQQQQQQQHEPVHCFWALMTYGDLRFIYLSSSVQRAVSVKYKQLLGQSFFDYIHPDEAKLARKDLNAFMDVHNLYGSVTRCRFKNVCPEWQQRKLSRQPRPEASPSVSAEALQAAAAEGGLSSRGLGRNGLRQNEPDNIDSANNNKLGTAAAPSETQQGNDTTEEGCKDYDDIFQGEDDFMILDVVMNVVSDEVVLGFFHIDGQGLYKGFWSNGICGESKESLVTLAPEIMRHLRESVNVKYGTGISSPASSPRRPNSDQSTKRIFQLYDSHTRNLLLTWPEPGNQVNEPGTMVYNPELYTQIVKSHHIPADALENTTCLKRFCSKHALPNLDPSNQEPSYQVESVFIPYGHIIFACFQTSPTAPVNSWNMAASPATSAAATPGSQLSTSSPGSRSFGANYESAVGSDHLSNLGLLSSPSQASSTLFGNTLGSSSSGLNSPLVIPSLPSLSPFLKHAVAGQLTMASGQTTSPSLTGPIRGTPGSTTGHPAAFHPYSRNSGLSNTSAAPSPSSLPLPDSMQESLSFLSDYKAGDPDRERGGALSDERQMIGGEGPAHSIWHASTPHPAIAAMVGHALAPSSPSFQRTVNSTDIGSSHARQKSSMLSTSTEARSQSRDKDAKSSKLSPSHRHPAHDAAIRKSSVSSSASPPASHQDTDIASGQSEHGARGGQGGQVLRVQQEEKACESCGTTNSPEWRRGQSGKKDLCNACGLRYSRSVARQNRQAQKQLDGKAVKPKAPKTGKASKASPKKGGIADANSLGSATNVHSNQPGLSDQSGQIFMQDPQLQQRQHQHQQPSHFPPSILY